MRPIRYIIIMFLFLLMSCAVSKKTVTGFSEEFKPVFLLYLTTVVIEKELESSGWFVDIVHENGRRLTLFIPDTDSKKLNIRNVISKIEDSNNPNDWSFFYCDFRGLSIDSITNYMGKRLSYNFYQTVISQNWPFIHEKEKMKEYTIKYHYVPSASFCQASIDIPELNKYNSVVRIQDGEPKPTKTPFFVFKEEAKSMKILLANSDFCR